MKINKRSYKVHEDICVFPRKDEVIAFTLRAIADTESFDTLIPDPMPPVITWAGSDEPRPDFTDEDYKAALSRKANLRVPWYVINTISATEGLEWEDVRAEDPTTWGKWLTELKAFGLTDHEVGILVSKVFEVNSMDQKKLDAARESFLRSAAKKQTL